MSPNDTSLIEKEGADVDGAEREGGIAESYYLDRKCALLRLTVA